MIAVDAGVMVAAFSSWHEDHDRARELVRGESGAIGHALVEAYSVLTRLPSPYRAVPSLVTAFLRAHFHGQVLALDGPAVRDLIMSLPRLSISGGAVYDAVIGATAADAGATLVTLDRRAMSVYERVGCDARLLTA